MTKPNTWAQRYGARRQAIDRALLAELEQTIAALKEAEKLQQMQDAQTKQEQQQPPPQAPPPAGGQEPASAPAGEAPK